MSVVLEKSRADRDALPSRSHLDWLESEAIFILREVAGECANPVLLFSGGKDSIVLLRLSPSRCCTSTPATTSRR